MALFLGAVDSAQAAADAQTDVNIAGADAAQALQDFLAATQVSADAQADAVRAEGFLTVVKATAEVQVDAILDCLADQITTNFNLLATLKVFLYSG